MLTPKRAVVVLLSIVLVCLILLVGLAVHPGPAEIETQVGEAEMAFSASRRWVVRSGDCVQVQWNLQHIQAIFLNGRGRIGEDQEQFCIEDEPRTFKFEVHFTDNTVRTYTLKVGFIGYQPEIWLLAAVGLTGLIAALYLIVAFPFKQRFPGAAQSIRRAVSAMEGLAFCFLVASVVLELGLRFYFNRYGTEETRIKYVYDDETIRRDSTLQPMPFIEYGLSAGGGNSLGYRGAEIAIPKPGGVYRIVVLGDSTIYGLATPANLTLPAQLQTVLRDDYGYSNVEVINAGVAGYNSWNSVTNLEFRVLELEPDLIIIYHTITDIGMREVTPDCYRGLNTHRGLTPYAAVLQLHHQAPSSSVLVRFVGITSGWFDAPDPDKNFETVISCVNDPIPSVEEVLAQNPPVYFERNLRTMVGIAREYNIEVMLSTWAYDASTPPDKRPDWWSSAPEQNEVIRKVAREDGTLFFDLQASAMSTMPDNWGSDRVHPQIQGYLHQAQLYAAYLDEQGIIPLPDDEETEVANLSTVHQPDVQ